MDFSSDYQFANLPVSYLNEMEDVDMIVLNPILDELLLTTGGEIHLGKVTAILTGSVLIFILCVMSAYIKFRRLCECAKACFIKIIPTKAHTS